VLSIDGHDVSQILTALAKAQKTKGRPTVIVAETVKGKGFSFAENNAAFHNSALTADQYRQALSELEARRGLV
jgi:transketolase